MNNVTGHLASIRRLDDGNVFGYVDEDVLAYADTRSEVVDLLRRLADYVEDGRYERELLPTTPHVADARSGGVDLAPEADLRG